MKIHLFHLLLISLSVLQLCSSSQAADQEKSKSQILEEPYKDIPVGKPVMHRLGAGELDKDGWCLAKPTRGNFSVMLPAKFLDSMMKTKTKTGGYVLMHKLETKTADGVEFHVMQSDIFGKRPEGSFVDKMIDKFKKQPGVSVTRENVVLAKLPAVKLSVKAKGVATEFIMLISSKTDYMLVVQSRHPDVGKAKQKADIKRFFESFKILSGKEEKQ